LLSPHGGYEQVRGYRLSLLFRRSINLHKLLIIISIKVIYIMINFEKTNTCATLNYFEYQSLVLYFFSYNFSLFRVLIQLDKYRT
jgi:hypothetical protein